MHILRFQPEFLLRVPSHPTSWNSSMSFWVLVRWEIIRNSSFDPGRVLKEEIERKGHTEIDTGRKREREGRRERKERERER